MSVTKEFLDSLDKNNPDYYTLKIEDKFKKLLEIEFEVENNPKKDLLYSKAWELGHSNGYYEVYIHYVDLVELIK